MRASAVFKYCYCSRESHGTTIAGLLKKLRIESTDNNCTNFISAESLQLDCQSGARIEEV